MTRKEEAYILIGLLFGLLGCVAAWVAVPQVQSTSFFTIIKIVSAVAYLVLVSVTYYVFMARQKSKIDFRHSFPRYSKFMRLTLLFLVGGSTILLVWLFLPATSLLIPNIRIVLNNATEKDIEINEQAKFYLTLPATLLM